MTVKELIEELQRFNQNDEVFVSYPSGDYWGTVCAREVEYVETQSVVYSEYHRSHMLVDDENYERYENGELKSVVIL